MKNLMERFVKYDWPLNNEHERKLLERYSYFDVKPEAPKLSQIEL